MPEDYMESLKRTLVKAVVWAAIGLLSMILVGAGFTGSIKLGGWMAVTNSVIGLLAYVLYERVWSQINWGRQKGRLDSRKLKLGSEISK
jgi:uncharacterized membrane protein